MSSLPFEVYVRHRGYRLPYPLHRWHLPEEREDPYAPEDFKPSEFDPVNLILYRSESTGPITLSIEGTPYQITLEDGGNYKELLAWTPPKDEESERGEGLWGRAGLYRIRVTHGTDAWVTTIEVQPHYLNFEQMGQMCADIERLSTWVAYDILPYAPVASSRIPRMARQSEGDEDPAVQFALLKETVPEALRTLRFLSSSPHLSLKPTYVATRTGVSARQDRRSMRMEERLSVREEGWTVQRTGELSYDIYENRFVKRLLVELQRRLGQLQARFMDALDELERQEDEVRRRLHRQFGDQEERIQAEEPLWTRPIRNRRSGLRAQIVSCGRMKDSLATILRTDLMREVQPLRGIVRPTNILQHDPQYSRLWSIYRLLRITDRGDESMAHRFHRRSRPSWELYEMWTAVQVMETCMRDLRFTRVLSQTVAAENTEGVVYLYDTPRPATIRLAHETEPIHMEIIYGGFIPMSDQALMAYRHARQSPSDGTPTEGAVDQEPLPLDDSTETNPAMDLDSPPVETNDPAEQMNSEESDPSDRDPAPTMSNTGAPEGDSDPHSDGLSDESEETEWEEPEPFSLLDDEDQRLVTRGVQTAPDLQIRFYDAETDEMLGVVILDAKYKGGRRIWGREEGRPTNDRLALESYLMDIHRRDREEAAAALYSEPADEIIMGAFALFPGERFGHDLEKEERWRRDGRLGAVRLNPDETPSEELIQLLLGAMAHAQLRVKSTRAAKNLSEGMGETPQIGHNGLGASAHTHSSPLDI